MRHFAAIVLLVALLASGGCFTTGAKDVPPPPPQPVPNVPPPVTADMVTPQNARACLQALAEEMDRTEQQLMYASLQK